MRQVFSSPRLENVERVAQLLRDAGIEVQILNGRSYKGNRRGTFSYREDAGGPRPAVWVTRSDEQPRARELLREAGLLQSQPSARSYLQHADVVFAPATQTPRRGMSRAAKVRYTLLGGAVLVVALSWLAKPGDETTVESPAEAPVAAEPETVLDMVPPTVEATVNRVPVPRALATLVLADALASTAGPVCVAVDGTTPPAPLIAELEQVYPDVRPASACAGGDGQAAWLEVSNYRTDGSGVGTLELVRGGTDAAQGLVRRTLNVRRDGHDWQFEAVD
ncbi:hypothetical protein CNR27_07545 [Luteimonas chenhongjianii]|uniref:Pathogenicity-like protein n=1 Tax=Luteimonas chenhongjianii TaxID=2006110 RepID=A0A290XE11_9GAMM|nr:DUF2007 domain-containing protein [Luteimonas chenhongjianii]ATD67311.1 hypothetical protein CNR27_07545 [Luteimonas chenhongjianii]